MGELFSYVGGACFVGATIPQYWKFFRTRHADDFSWGFIALNLGGTGFFTLRSAEIGEQVFFVVNALGAMFWAAAIAVKAVTSRATPGWRA